MDLGSRNGTFVNDQRVVMPVTLEPGARVRIANYELVFDQSPDDEPSGNVDATLAAGSMEGHQAVLSVAILVCDIRGFSSMAEKLGKRELAQIIGNWFRDIGNAVQSAGGIIDKYIGDALLAYWPAETNREPMRSLPGRGADHSPTCRQSSLAGNRDPFSRGDRGPFWPRDQQQYWSSGNERRDDHWQHSEHGFPSRGRHKDLNQNLVLSQDFVTVSSQIRIRGVR